MKIVILFTFIFSLIKCQTSFSNLEGAANFTCYTMLNSKTFNQTQYFSQSFLYNISNIDTFLKIEQLEEAIGSCSNYETTSTTGVFKIISNTGDYGFISIQLDITGLIDIFNINSVSIPSIVVKTWNDALNYAEVIGNIGLIITDQNSTASKTKAFNYTTRNPLGFGMSVYILAEVARRVEAAENQWEDTFPIIEQYNFPPYNGKGIMQNLPDGTQVSLLELTQNMIQYNDNTAANQLFNILTRSKIEEQLFLLNDTFANYTLPFLSISELYKLKYAISDSDRQNYINSDIETRRLILSNTIDNISMDEINYQDSQPVDIYDIEWFGNQLTQCQGLFSFLDLSDATVLSALSLNTPFIDITVPFSFWNYIGYIGGTTPGVITHTYLMHSYDGDWICFSLSVASENVPINQWIVGDYVNKLVNVIEQFLSLNGGNLACNIYAIFALIILII